MLKAAALSWKVLLYRVPTRTNLCGRNILPLEATLWCVSCETVEESVNHLFLHCRDTMSIWASLMRWLGLSFIMPPDLFIHWECCWSGGGEEVEKGAVANLACSDLGHLDSEKL